MCVFLTPVRAYRKGGGGGVTQTVVLGYLLPSVSKAASYLASICGGTFPLELRTEIGKSNSEAASSGMEEVPPDVSVA